MGCRVVCGRALQIQGRGQGYHGRGLADKEDKGLGTTRPDSVGTEGEKGGGLGAGGVPSEKSSGQRNDKARFT